jgi:hypothetical protein
VGLGLGFRHKFRIYDDLENIIGGFVEEDEETNGSISKWGTSLASHSST